MAHYRVLKQQTINQPVSPGPRRSGPSAAAAHETRTFVHLSFTVVRPDHRTRFTRSSQPGPFDPIPHAHAVQDEAICSIEPFNGCVDAGSSGSVILPLRRTGSNRRAARGDREEHYTPLSTPANHLGRLCCTPQEARIRRPRTTTRPPSPAADSRGPRGPSQARTRKNA